MTRKHTATKRKKRRKRKEKGMGRIKVIQKRSRISSMLLIWSYELQGKAVSENEYYVN